MVSWRKAIPISLKIKKTTPLGSSPYEMVLNQKPRKLCLQLIYQKNGYCQPKKDSIC